jgi:outer membrane protein, heavy metal efflux system
MSSARRCASRAALVALAVAAGAASGLEAQTPGLTLEGALARALEANPQIAAARLSRPVGVAGIAVARERPNPEITYEASRELPHQAIGGTLPIELGGKRARRIELATAGVTTREAELDQVIADIRNQVRRAYFALVAAEARVALVTDTRALAVRARNAAQARFAAGDVSRLEVVQTTLALADAENDLTGARGEATAARGELNALLGQPAAAPLTLVDGLAAVPLPALDDAVSQAGRSNAALVVLDRRIAEQDARRRLALALQTPDLAAGSAFTYHAQPEFTYGWRLDFGVTVPVFTKHRAGVQLEDAELVRLRADRAATMAEITGAVTAALARAAALRDQLLRYDAEILPEAEDVERMAQDAYTSGQSGLVALLQSLQFTRDIRRRALQAGLDFQTAVADLERAIGTPLIR